MEHSFEIPSQETLMAGDLSERYKLGKILSVSSLLPEQLNIEQECAPRAIYEVDIEDPYVKELDPDLVESVRMHERLVDRYARERRFSGSWQRQVGTAYTDENGMTKEDKTEWGDPVAHARFFDDVDSEGLRAWLNLIPSAAALSYLTDPLTLDNVVNKRGKYASNMDDMSRLWLTACTDAIGIRSRGTLMAELVSAYVKDSTLLSVTSDETSKLRWMSIACGTALPAMKAAMLAGIKPELMLVDIDSRAMKSTEKLGQEIKFEGDISQHRINIFDDSEMATLRGELGNNGERPMVIDLMGIFEYTGEALGVDPAKFLRSNYDMLHPGGRLIFGQMRSTRPVPDFTMGVVGWPFVEMRSPKEFMKVIKDAGISTNNTSLYLPTDGVYTVGVIDKPLDAEAFAAAA